MLLLGLGFRALQVQGPLEVENAALRHQLRVLQRKVRGRVEVGPFASNDGWMEQHLGVDPRSKINKLRILKCVNDPSIERFEYDVKYQNEKGTKNSDIGGHHVAFYVKDIRAAIDHLHRHGVKVLGEPTPMNEGPSAGLNWIYFSAPWGMTLAWSLIPGEWHMKPMQEMCSGNRQRIKSATNSSPDPGSAARRTHRN